MKTLTIQEMIEKYEIERVGNQLKVPNGKEKLTSTDIEMLKSNKAAILEYFEAEEKKAEEKRANEYQKMIDSNHVLNLEIMYYSGMKSIVCLPEELREYEDLIIENIEFDFDAGYGDYGKSYLHIGLSDLIAKISEIKNELEIKKAEKAKKEKEYYEEKLAEAKEKNEKVIFAQWSDECNDPEEECNIDNITKYLNPNGTFEIVRSHTW